MAKIDKNRDSIKSLEILLLEVISAPTSYMECDSLYKCLTSQGGLAKYSNQPRGIVATSLNTLKRISSAEIEGGFSGIDKLRLLAKLAIDKEKEKISRPGKINKLGLKNSIDQLKVDNQRLKEELFVLTIALDKSLSQGANYARLSGKASIIEICKKEQNEILDMFSIREHKVGRVI